MISSHSCLAVMPLTTNVASIPVKEFRVEKSNTEVVQAHSPWKRDPGKGRA
jgi:hypothetical protein